MCIKNQAAVYLIMSRIVRSIFLYIPHCFQSKLLLCQILHLSLRSFNQSTTGISALPLVETLAQSIVVISTKPTHAERSRLFLPPKVRVLVVFVATCCAQLQQVV